MGMGMKFREVEPQSVEILRLWLTEVAELPKQANA
jgi:hypothetical protein